MEKLVETHKDKVCRCTAKFSADRLVCTECGRGSLCESSTHELAEAEEDDQDHDPGHVEAGDGPEELAGGTHRGLVRVMAEMASDMV